MPGSRPLSLMQGVEVQGLGLHAVENKTLELVAHRQAIVLLVDEQRRGLFDQQLLRLSIKIEPLLLVRLYRSRIEQLVELGIGIIPPVVTGAALRLRIEDRPHIVIRSGKRRPPYEAEGVIGRVG